MTQWREQGLDMAVSVNIGARQLQLDDVGTGYSSLAHLRHLPVEVIKIDQSFVCDMPEDQDELVQLTH